MTEQEAQVLAARLTRIWASLGPDFTSSWEQAIIPRLRWSYVHQQDTDVLVLATSKGVARVVFRIGHLELRWTSHCIECCFQGRVISPDHASVRDFARQWLPVFRRNCWLSGCAIEANAAEKAEWIEIFPREEIDVWNLDFYKGSMESQVLLDEQMEREAAFLAKQARRAAVAFGLEETQWDEMDTDEDGANFRFHKSPFFICSFDKTGELNSVCIGPLNKDNTENWPDDPCQVARFDGVWEQWGGYMHPDYREWMARGLYCFGFEQEEVFAQLPHLSAHEKLELRLAFPREFWPQTWLDEENG